MAFPSPPPDSEPIYVVQAPIDHSYGYGYPPPLPTAGKRSDPRVGWLLVAAGALALVGAFLPWFHVVAPVDPDPYGSTTIDDARGGLVVILFSLLIMTAGAWIGVRRGDLWSPIAGLVGSAVNILLALLAIAGETVVNAFAFENEATARFGAGLWLDLVSGVVALVLSIVALTRRKPLQEPR